MGPRWDFNGNWWDTWAWGKDGKKHGFLHGAHVGFEYFSRMLKLLRTLSERWRKPFWKQIFKDLYVLRQTRYMWVLHGINVGFPQN